MLNDSSIHIRLCSSSEGELNLYRTLEDGGVGSGC